MDNQHKPGIRRVLRLLVLGVMLLWGMGGCDLFLDRIAPPEWIYGGWAGPYAPNQDNAYVFRKDSFATGAKYDDHFSPTEQFYYLGRDEYQQSTDSQYVVHMTNHWYNLQTGWYTEDTDWTFRKISTDQIEASCTSYESCGGILDRFMP
jgi:hypothetical protein